MNAGLLAVFAGCVAAAVDETGPQETDAVAPSREDVRAVLDARCVLCHQGPFADGALDLTPGPGVLVDVASTEVPSMKLVAPGSLDDSYVWHKLQGTALDVGGVDSQMPFDGTAPLSEPELATIAGWITAGAL